MDETTTILVETRGNVGIITLNRPDILNAVNLVMLNEIAYQVETWEYDDNIRAIVIKGSDKAFAAGIDIKEMSQEVSQQVYEGLSPDEDVQRPRSKPRTLWRRKEITTPRAPHS